MFYLDEELESEFNQEDGSEYDYSSFDEPAFVVQCEEQKQHQQNSLTSFTIAKKITPEIGDSESGAIAAGLNKGNCRNNINENSNSLKQQNRHQQMTSGAVMMREHHQNQRYFKTAVHSNPNRSNHRAKKWHFNDYYKLEDDHLGSGAYASVRTAKSLTTGREYAVKVVNKHENGHTRSRLLREVQIFRMCRDHANIVQLIEWFEDETHFYMVFEKMHGGPLLNHIQKKVCFTEQEASQVTRDIANALKYLHDRGIAHRDVKPENILCTDADRVSPVKLCDLDLASKPLSKEALGQRNSDDENMSPLHPVPSEPDLASPVGSAEFMAPEVVDAFVGEALKYDKRCDMWSLGVIIYIMLCGYPPFYGECERDNCGWDQGDACHDCQNNLFHRIQDGAFDFPEEEWTHISREAKDLICHLLVRNVRQRYTADDVLRHPWVTRGAPKTPLQTASNLFRNDSARDVHQMNEHFNIINSQKINTRLVVAGQPSPQQIVIATIGGGAATPTPSINSQLKHLCGNNTQGPGVSGGSILVTVTSASAAADSASVSSSHHPSTSSSASICSTTSSSSITGSGGGQPCGQHMQQHDACDNRAPTTILVLVP